MWQDFRYALRALAVNRAVTLVAVACLALGIGVNATLFSVIDGVLLQPFPFADPDRIVEVESTKEKQGLTEELSYPDFRDMSEAATTVSALAAFQTRSLTISDGQNDPERYQGAAVSAGLFPLLGIPPFLGRHFEPADDRPGAEPVIILSHDVWKQRYNSDPNVVGRAISINLRPHTIVGVMPPRFAFPTVHRLWVPLAPYGHGTRRDERGLGVFARMKPGVTIQQVRSDIGAIAERLARQYPDENEGWGATVRPLSEWMVPDDVRLVLVSMMGAVTLVLLIACTNVANLLFARASVRSREISIRTALGAGRWRIARALLVEAVLLGALSAPLGIAIAAVGIDLLSAAMPPDGVPYFIRWELDWRTLAYTCSIALLTGIIFGLAPALHAANPNLQETLKEGGRGTTGGRARLRHALVVLEIALSLVLLVSAALFVRSFLNLQSAGTGFDTRRLMTMRFVLPGTEYEAADAKVRRVRDIVARVEALPGVEAAFASNFVPLAGGGSGGRVLVDGRAFEPGTEPLISFVAATPHFRKTLGVPLVRGRDLTDADATSRAPVALVNARMAKELWGDADPVGRRFRLTGERVPHWFTVVGVVGDFLHSARDTDGIPAPSTYVPYEFDPTFNTGLTIRVAGEPAGITAAVREQIRGADRSLPVFAVRTMEDVRLFSFWEDRLFGWMFGVFGAVAIVLAAIGVFGVLSYSVSQRTQEIGVRVALGAGRADIMRLIVGHGLRLAAAGVALGLAGAFGAGYFVRSLLYNVRPADPVSFVGVSVFLILVAAIASYVPARRAVAVDPLVALRSE